MSNPKSVKKVGSAVLILDRYKDKKGQDMAKIQHMDKIEVEQWDGSKENGVIKQRYICHMPVHMLAGVECVEENNV